MYTAHRVLSRVVLQTLVTTLVWSAATAVVNGQASTTTVTAVQTGAVGGVSIDTDGVLNNARQDDSGTLSKLLRESLEKIPGELNPAVTTRKVSLRGIEAVLDDCEKNNKPIPDAIKYLGGLQRIHYIFVYPEQKDIVLVGPGEGWKVDAKGMVVGVGTGRPVMLLDDLLVALRTGRAAADGGITCSIDPTPEGLARMGAVSLHGDRQAVLRQLETALGMQRISVHGVPETSHFARVLVAADYRMKRLGMNLDPSPVRGLPSYLHMVKSTARSAVSPRFWLEPKFEALLRDAEGLAWELRGSGVKAMTEDDFIASTGAIRHSGKGSPLARKWADNMTEKYAELAVADPIFGQLQNCMELAIVGALVAKDRLTEKAGNSLPTMMDSPAVKPLAFNAPKQVESQASVLNRVVMSGGVAINSWAIADKAKRSDAVSPLRTKAARAESTGWYWN